MHYSYYSTLNRNIRRRITSSLVLALTIILISQPAWPEDTVAFITTSATTPIPTPIPTPTITQTTTTSPTSTPTPSLPPYKVHIALAGGGWRALNGHAGWTLSVLKANKSDLTTAFKNVGAISSNSGGSWFSTMLAYSTSFVDAIEADNAAQNWSKSGPEARSWLGQQQYLFDQAPCHDVSGDLFALCVAAYYTGSPIEATYWHKIVEGVIFKNHPIEGPLSGKRQAWAEGKALLLASSMLTAETVIGQVGLHQQYYQACLTPSKPIFNSNRELNDHKEFNAKEDARCDSTKTAAAMVTPVTFASVPKNSTYHVPPFFSATNSMQTHFDVGYSETALLTPTRIYTTLENPAHTDNVPIIVAASASSAAAGFAASKAVTGSWLESYVASNEPLSFQLSGGLKHINANGISAKELATQKVVQIADGGAVDNSAVSQLIGFLQQNGEAEGFNVLAFDNVQQTFKPENAAEIGVDLANLFGKGLWRGNQICSAPNGAGHCVTAPNTKIFEIEPLLNTPITWGVTASTNTHAVSNALIYTQYAVTTVDNPVYGIKAGSRGTLHAFTAAWSDAPTAPDNTTQDSSFMAYGNMVEFIQSGLQQTNKNGVSGAQFLQQALGLQ